jgi:hypothetical protein
MRLAPQLVWLLPVRKIKKERYDQFINVQKRL